MVFLLASGLPGLTLDVSDWKGEKMRGRVLRRVVFGWISLIIIVALLGKVSIAASNAGRTAADFLLIGIGARAAGMGGAYTSVSEGAAASYWNPAGLTSVDGGEVALGHFAWYQDITLEHATAAYRINERTTLAASMTFLDYGQIDGYDANGMTTGDITAYDWSGALSVGMRTGYNISVGLTGKFINQKLDDLSAATFAMDLGMKYLTDRLVVAAVIANIGPDMEFNNLKERIPTTVRLGISGYPIHETFMTSIEFEKKVYGGTVIRHGFEVNFSGRYFLRTGYSYFPNHKSRSFGSGISMGAGVRFGGAEIDYAYTLKERYSSEDLHRSSLLLKFNPK